MYIDSLRHVTKGSPVMVDGDTLFYLYTKTGGQSVLQRAQETSELIELLGESKIDSLLERMFINEFYGSDDFVNFGSIDLVDGHQYVLDIFESNDFNDNLEWFYKITVEEFLNLEDLRVNKIPFLTYYLKYFVQEGEMLEPQFLRYYDESSDSYTFYLEPEAVR